MGMVSQFAKCAEIRNTPFFRFSSEGKFSRPVTVRRASASFQRILSRCAYSAMTRPRLSHIPLMIVSISSVVFSGNAARRFSRARLENLVGAISLRPIQPPIAEALSKPNRRKKPMIKKKPAASARYRSLRASGNFGPSLIGFLECFALMAWAAVPF